MGTHHRMADVMALRLASVEQFAVLTVLAHHWNATAAASWPSLATIAASTGLSVRAVRYAMRRLEAAGIITATGIRTGGRNNPTRYRINLPSANGNPAPGAAFGVEKPGTARPETRHSASVNPAPGAAEPLNHMNRGAPDGAAPDGATPGARKNGTRTAAPNYPDKRRRQLIDLADVLNVQRRDGEAEPHWLMRVDAANQVRLHRHRQEVGDGQA